MPGRLDPKAEVPKLGDLEIAVLEYVWSSAGVTAKAVHEAIGVSRGIALNTVQSALERLYRKELLNREKCSHSFSYSAAVRREQLIGRLISDVLGRFGADPSLALAAFIEATDDIDPGELRRLEDILRRRQEDSGA